MVRKITVFFSWQSDTPPSIGRNALRDALRKACKEIEKRASDTKLIIDEATRGATGSINIATKIIEKIQAADIFIADVTTITPLKAARPCPNPNVSYELGFGVGEVGWDRTVMLFNTAVGEFPRDLPFDLMQNRTLTFEIRVGDETNGIRKLSEQLTIGIGEIVRAEPKRPAQLRGLSKEKVEHDHDVEQIRWLLSTMHLPTLDEHIEHLPDRVRSKCLWFHDHFAGVETNSLFSIYDPTLNDTVRTFARAWDTATSYGVKYDGGASSDLYSFKGSGQYTFTDDDEKAWSEIAKARKTMRESLDRLLARVRSHYHEVDIRKTNETAWRDYYREVIEEGKKLQRSKHTLASSRKSLSDRKLVSKRKQTAKRPGHI